MSIGEKIKQARERAGLTKKELAERLGVAYQTINRFETGKRLPQIQMLKKISTALGIEDYAVFLDSTDIENLYKEPSPRMKFSMADKLMGEQIRTLVLPVIDGVEYDVRIEVRLAE